MDSVQKMTLIALDGLFLLLACMIAVSGNLPDPGVFFFPLLGLASFRMGRALAFNLIFKPLRDSLGCIELPDSSGAGDNVHATGEGIRRALGELVTCPICAGTWAAILLLFSWSLFPPLGLALIYALAGAGLAELFHWLSESLQWQGRESREVSGLMNRESKKEYYGPMKFSRALREDLEAAGFVYGSKRKGRLQ